MLGQTDLWSDSVQFVLTITSKHFINLYKTEFIICHVVLLGLRFLNYKWLPKEEKKIFKLFFAMIQLYKTV